MLRDVPSPGAAQKFQISAYFPKSCSKLTTQKLCEFLMECNEGLQGDISPLEIKQFPQTHARHGARIVVLSGNQAFLDSLQGFPKDFPSDIKIANVYIRGGTRTEEAKHPARRPKITRGSIEACLLYTSPSPRDS